MSRADYRNGLERNIERRSKARGNLGKTTPEKEGRENAVGPKAGQLALGGQNSEVLA